MTTLEDPGIHPPAWDGLLAQSFPIALALALDAEEAPSRCKRRVCKVAGACRVKVAEGRPASCGGGSIEDHVLEKASFGALVALQVVIAAGLVPME